MNTSDEELKLLRRRILLDFQIQRGTNAWAPWGQSGWSAVEVQKAQRKWAQVHRIKPATGERSGKTTGKVRKDQLIKRDPALKGADRPEFTPEEIFTEAVTPEDVTVELSPPVVEEKQVEAVLDRPASMLGARALTAPAEQRPKLTPREHKAKIEAIERALALIDDDSTEDDW